MSKQLLFGQEAQEKLLRGIEVLYKAVSATLGPVSGNVAIERKWGTPLVVHDGVTVAKEIDVADSYENMGVNLVKEAASKTNDVTGDGTTTATILAYHIVKAFLKNSKPMQLREQLLEEVKNLSLALKESAIPVGEADVLNISTISAQDKEIGSLIAEAFKKMGKDGLITVEEGKGTTLTVDYKEGMAFDKGYASAYFITDQDRREVEIKNASLFLTDKKISSADEMTSILEKMVKTNKNIVIIADDVEGEALAILVLNTIKGVVNALAVRAPGFGDRRKEMLEDIAIVTGGKVVAEAMGDITNFSLDDLGQADKVWADKDTTHIIGGNGAQEEIESQVQKIRFQLENTEMSDFEKEKLRERLSKLTNGAAVINIGARTEAELKEKKERALDAVSASRAALEEGIIPGGATTLIYLVEKGSLLEDIVKKPFEVLMRNSELSYEVDVLKKFGWGIDVMDGKYKDMIDAGITDPAKVVREALENAVSVATTILTTKVLIADKEEKHEN